MCVRVKLMASFKAVDISNMKRKRYLFLYSVVQMNEFLIFMSIPIWPGFYSTLCDQIKTSKLWFEFIVSKLFNLFIVLIMNLNFPRILSFFNIKIRNMCD